MGWRDWIPKDSAPMPEARRPPRERIPGGLAVSAPRVPATAGRAIARDSVRALSVEGHERAAIASEDGSLPRAYAGAWAALQEGPPPGVPQERWARAVADAGAFLDEWGPRAAALGWSVADLFDPPGRWAPGLVWTLEGGAVALLTDREAVFARDGRRVWLCIPPHTGHDRETRNG